jgi:hypothetical protein
MNQVFEFIQTGSLGPVSLGMSATAVLDDVGEPDQTSRKSNPLLLIYGCVSLTFLRSPSSRTPQLREVVVALANYPGTTPSVLSFADFEQLGDLRVLQFAHYLERKGHPSYLTSIAEGDGEVVFPSGVKATFKKGYLESFNLQPREIKEAGSLIANDAMTISDVNGLLDEAAAAAEAKAYRAALLVGWSALEATLRLIANRHGISKRQSFTAATLTSILHGLKVLPAPQARRLEVIRQMRMAAAHGMPHPNVSVDAVKDLLTETRRLLASLPPDQ